MPIDRHFDPTISLRGFSKFGSVLRSKLEEAKTDDVASTYAMALAINNLSVSLLVSSGNAERKIPLAQRQEEEAARG